MQWWVSWVWRIWWASLHPSATTPPIFGLPRKAALSFHTGLFRTLPYAKDAALQCRRSGLSSKLHFLITHTSLPLLGLSFLLWKMRELDWMFSLFFNLFIYFHWRIITLLWCFLPYISMNTCVPSVPKPPPTSLPTPSLQVATSFGYPASYIKLALVMYFTYGNVYVSIIFSQIIPPSPPPTEPKNLFFTSVFPLSVSPVSPCM